MTKEKALYQTKLILDYLPEEEYQMIPNDIISYIEENMEYDENIKVSSTIPLEKQRIDDKTYKILEDIMKKIDYKLMQNQSSQEKENNEIQNIKLENIKLKKILESNKIELEKLPKIKALLEEYKSALRSKDDEIVKLKKQNEQLYLSIKNTPKLFRKIFFKDFEQKLLK